MARDPGYGARVQYFQVPCSGEDCEEVLEVEFEWSEGVWCCTDNRELVDGTIICPGCGLRVDVYDPAGS